jgi:hypothetical protein
VDLRSAFCFFFLVLKLVCVLFQVCCRGSECDLGTGWLPAPISSKNGLTITLTVDSSCVEKQLHSLRYLWRETPCPFKGAAIYSYTDPNLPSPPYFKYF